MDSINSIQGVATDFRQPLVMIIGLLNKEPGIRPRESKRVGVSLTEPLLEVLKIPHVLVDVQGDEARIAGLVEEAYSTSNPIAILIGREVV
jgi:sulfopyruvate decarboxylase subunit alpha